MTLQVGYFTKYCAARLKQVGRSKIRPYIRELLCTGLIIRSEKNFGWYEIKSCIVA